MDSDSSSDNDIPLGDPEPISESESDFKIQIDITRMTRAFDWHLNTKEKEIGRRYSHPMMSRTKLSIFDTPVKSISSRKEPEKRFPTNSKYKGYWNKLGFTHHGTYVYPHGVIYEGPFKDGMFHGTGILLYPTGYKIEGLWVRGVLKKCEYKAPKMKECLNLHNYCKMPDRRFALEISEGMNPARKEYVTPENVPPAIPDKCYDTIDGFYRPSYDCIFKRKVPLNVTRPPMKWDKKEKMIRYRNGLDLPTGYQPDLYEFWTYGAKKDIQKIEEYFEDSDSISENIDTESFSLYGF